MRYGLASISSLRRCVLLLFSVGVVFVSELVSALLSEDVIFLMSKCWIRLGRFSIRQMALFIMFGLLGWVVFGWVSHIIGRDWIMFFHIFASFSSSR